MGVDIDIYKGYGIMILTKDLTEEQKKLIFNDMDDEEQGSAIDYIHFDHYDNEDSKWLFIPITAKKKKEMEYGIQQYYLIKGAKNIPSFILPLFNLEDSSDKEKALLDLNEIHEKRKAEVEEEEEKQYLDKSFSKVLKVLENKDAWYAGKYLVNYYS